MPTIPGLPTRPCFYDIDLDPETEQVNGLFWSGSLLLVNWYEERCRTPVIWIAAGEDGHDISVWSLLSYAYASLSLSRSLPPPPPDLPCRSLMKCDASSGKLKLFHLTRSRGGLMKPPKQAEPVVPSPRRSKFVAVRMWPKCPVYIPFLIVELL